METDELRDVDTIQSIRLEIDQLRLALMNLDEWAYRVNGSAFGTVYPIYTNCKPLIKVIEAVRQLVAAPRQTKARDYERRMD